MRTLWLLAPLTIACAAPMRTARSGAATDSYCAPAPSVDSTWDAPATGDLDTALRARFTTRTLEFARAVGLLPLLARLDDASGRVALLERVTALALQVDSLVAELDCEGERALQAAGSMRAREERLRRWLAVASLAVGGAATIATAALEKDNVSPTAQEVVGIVGGALSAAFGLAVLAVHEKRTFTHSRNLLEDIWRNPDRSALYPPALWTYLTRREFSNEGIHPIRHNVVARWQRFGQLGPDGSRERARRIALYFGSGGAYTTDDLQTRSDMLDQLKSSVDSMHQDLARLQRELVGLRVPAASLSVKAP